MEFGSEKALKPFGLEDFYNKYKLPTSYFGLPTNLCIKPKTNMPYETNMTKSANFDSQADDIILSWSSM